MHSTSHTSNESTSTPSKRRSRRVTVRHGIGMKGNSLCCGTGARSLIGNARNVSFRLSFEAKIVITLLLFATTVSISRTYSLLSNFDTSDGTRSLQIDQATSRSASRNVRVRIEFTMNSCPRVISWNETSDWIVPLTHRSTFGVPAKNLYDTIDTHEVYIDDDYITDPTRQYDQTDSADLPTLERPKWPKHDFDPHCQPAASWQSTFYPTCNEIHSGADLRQALIDGHFSLLSRKGYWRHAWLYQKEAIVNATMKITLASSQTVWKTLK
jgi:hypothetical protein